MSVVMAREKAEQGHFPVVATAEGIVPSPKDLSNASSTGDYQSPQTSSSWPSSAKDFVLLFPPAPYTVTRTLSRRDHRVLMLDYHVARLVSSLKTTRGQRSPEAGPNENDVTEEEIRSQCQHCASLILSSLSTPSEPSSSSSETCPPDPTKGDEMKSNADFDMMLTLVLVRSQIPNSTAPTWRVVAHAAKMTSPRSFICLDVVGSGRSFVPAAKHSSWIRERRPTEALKSNGVHELVLSDDDGGLLEGLITNFFVVTNKGVVQTASRGILHGHMRELVVDACKRLDIPVELTSPNAFDAATWSEAFVTSAVQVATSARSISFSKFPTVEPREFDLDSCPITTRIRQEVIERSSLNVS